MLKLMRERTWQQICNGKLKSQFMHFLQFVYVSQKDYTYNNNEVLIWKCDESKYIQKSQSPINFFCTKYLTALSKRFYNLSQIFYD